MVLSERVWDVRGGREKGTMGEQSGVVKGTEGVGSVPVEGSPSVRVRILPSSPNFVDISTKPPDKTAEVTANGTY